MSITASNITLKVGLSLKQSDLIAWLADAHYEQAALVSSYGVYTRVGDTVRIYPVNGKHPLIIEFLGDTIETIAELEEGRKHVLEQFVLHPNLIDADGLVFSPGQYVVHLDHGIGQFKSLGMHSVTQTRQMNKYDDVALVTGDAWKPYLIVEYADGAELFVPPEQVGKLTHYIGGRAPALSRLGSKRWAVTRQKVEESLFKLAKELLVVAAKREMHTREAYVPQQEWLDVVASEFPYDATDDQQKAIDACLSDLLSPRPMDRLVCGDVGFGKTEVALRTAVAVASAGKQVALLAPTTLLVGQHRATFEERLKNLPIRIGMLSRFVSEGEKAEVKEKLKAGTLDIVIGTHSLLQESIDFANLGLVIIDEEQKFGVKHKEFMKKLRAEVDLLTLSATPIPRTLFSALSGLRDISLIMTPPKKRLPIKTFVQKHDESVIKKAITSELKRKGQVFVLHNDVASIQARAKQLRLLVPEARVEVGHGQMPEEQLSRVVEQLIHGKIDVFVTSTIIESGLDMPNVNTLIVERADHFGLSDLYQIRGRIGRSDRQAYAYCMYTTPELTKPAQLRLKALVEAEELGSGYELAIKDLEIRGGGNVLGKEQHGNMEAIGLSLYTKMLQLTVAKLRDQKTL